MTVVAASIATATLGISARSQAPEIDLRGVHGYVLTADGLPVASGAVHFERPGTTVEAAIGPNGRFQISPPVAGSYDVRVSAPDHMSRRLTVTVPRSGGLLLPPIRLTPASYVRLRVVGPRGEPLATPRIIRESYTITGNPMAGEPGDRGSDRVDEDGTVTIGPLPRGVTVLTLDSAPYARTRLPDVRVTGDHALIDAGTVRVDRGTTLEVLVVDEADTPVPYHDVILDSGAARSPTRLTLERTDSRGIVTFDRLTAGQYDLHARGVHRCQGWWQSVKAGIDVPAANRIRRRFQIGGVVFTVRATTGGAPLSATRLAIAQDAIMPAMAAWLRTPIGSPTLRQRLLQRAMGSECAGATGSDGRVSLTRAPQGVSRVSVLLANSSWSREISVPGRPAEVAVEIPTVILPVHVLSGAAPVGGATVTWTAAGGYVTATTTPTGDALLEGVDEGGGVLSVRAPGFLPYERRLPAPPGVHHQVSLVREPDTALRVQTLTEQGVPLSDAVIELLPRDPMEDPQVMTTDREGIGLFTVVAAGDFRIEARADGYARAAASVHVPKDDGKPLALTLRRGYRVAVAVDRGIGDHRTFAILVMNSVGASVDERLDARSDRAVEAGGRVSLGPLLPGSYVVELRRGEDVRRQQVRIDDRDTTVAFR
jgi:hypothetical protein